MEKEKKGKKRTKKKGKEERKTINRKEKRKHGKNFCDFGLGKDFLTQ